MINLQIEEEMNLAMIYFKGKLQNKLIRQGHAKNVSSSRLLKSFEHKIEAVSSYLVATMYANDYWEQLEYGVSASKIPYKRGSGAKTSKVIQGLIKHWKRVKALGNDEAKKAAFATVNAWKGGRGMPTRGSFKYSKDGTRLGFLSDTMNKYENEVYQMIEDGIANKVEDIFSVLLIEISVNV